jgi:hypothetical protein
VPPPVEGFRRLTPLPDWDPIALYEGPEPAPRAAVVDVAHVEPDANRALDLLFDERFDPAHEVAVDRPSAPAGTAGAPVAPSARIASDSGSSLELDAGAGDGGGYLVLLDSFTPGWRAVVDEQPAELVRADGLFRAVRLSPGAHHVRFVYAPPTLLTGAVVSAAAAAVLALIASWGRFRRGGSMVLSGGRELE